MPEDDIIWDVSHQCYPHKILTGRRDKMSGLHGRVVVWLFASARRVLHSFGAGHSSTSISAAQGMSVAKSMLQKKRITVSL
jgi:1-deoxy-D-xylulose-5-phosphate synthase